MDILEIRTVINFDLARDIDTHVHRIGRTGRAGVLFAALVESRFIFVCPYITFTLLYVFAFSPLTYLQIGHFQILLVYAFCRSERLGIYFGVGERQRNGRTFNKKSGEC